ncbi:hypothetical protein SUGI_0980200 [Cryptomeria japonica]|nr:hypothetical protein SUGI_0980200 [Cryptomeria japonica]
MAKGYAYVSMLLLLLMASSAFASEESMVYDEDGYCGFWSGAFKGACSVYSNSCDDTCKASDHAAFGVCTWTSKGLACICFNRC